MERSPQSADGRVATEAARRSNNRVQIGQKDELVPTTETG